MFAIRRVQWNSRFLLRQPQEKEATLVPQPLERMAKKLSFATLRRYVDFMRSTLPAGMPVALRFVYRSQGGWMERSETAVV
jgi:hypothetical protein